MKNICRKIWIKSVALSIAAVMGCDAMVWAAPVSTAQILNDQIFAEPWTAQVHIPSSLGAIQDVFQSKSNNTASLIHIEDAHGEPEAQKNIQRILEYLKNEHGVTAFFLEGAWSKLDPALLRFSEDNEANRKMLSELEEKGIVGGPENFLYENSQNHVRPATGSGQRVTGYGIEDLELYKKNLEQFRAVMSAKADSDIFLNEVKAGLMTKASQVLNPELAEYFRVWSFHEEIEKDYTAHLRALTQKAKDRLGLDLDDAREQYDWPMLVRFQKLKSYERDSGPAAQDLENKKLKNWLKEKNLEKRFTFLLTNHEPQETSREPRSLREMFEVFYETAAPHGFQFKDYPELSKEWGKQVLAQEMDVQSLFREIKLLEEKLLEALALTEEEKKVTAKYREYLLLRKLLRLELTREEWREIALSGPNVPPPYGAIMETAQAFYQTAEARDEAMVRRAVDWIKKQKIEKAAIITGGFHSQGMGNLLKEKNISYLRIQPRITQIHGRGEYLKTMAATSDLRPVSPAQPGVADFLPFIAKANRSESRSFDPIVKQLVDLHRLDEKKEKGEVFEENDVDFRDLQELRRILEEVKPANDELLIRVGGLDHSDFVLNSKTPAKEFFKQLDLWAETLADLLAPKFSGKVPRQDEIIKADFENLTAYLKTRLKQLIRLTAIQGNGLDLSLSFYILILTDANGDLRISFVDSSAKLPNRDLENSEIISKMGDGYQKIEFLDSVSFGPESVFKLGSEEYSVTPIYQGFSPLSPLLGHSYDFYVQFKKPELDDFFEHQKRAREKEKSVTDMIRENPFDAALWKKHVVEAWNENEAQSSSGKKYKNRKEIIERVFVFVQSALKNFNKESSDIRNQLGTDHVLLVFSLDGGAAQRAFLSQARDWIIEKIFETQDFSPLSALEQALVLLRDHEAGIVTSELFNRIQQWRSIADSKKKSEVISQTWNGSGVWVHYEVLGHLPIEEQNGFSPRVDPFADARTQHVEQEAEAGELFREEAEQNRPAEKPNTYKLVYYGQDVNRDILVPGFIEGALVGPGSSLLSRTHPMWIVKQNRPFIFEVGGVAWELVGVQKDGSRAYYRDLSNQTLVGVALQLRPNPQNDLFEQLSNRIRDFILEKPSDPEELAQRLQDIEKYFRPYAQHETSKPGELRFHVTPDTIELVAQWAREIKSREINAAERKGLEIFLRVYETDFPSQGWADLGLLYRLLHILRITPGTPMAPAAASTDETEENIDVEFLIKPRTDLDFFAPNVERVLSLIAQRIRSHEPENLGGMSLSASKALVDEELENIRSTEVARSEARDEERDAAKKKFYSRLTIGVVAWGLLELASWYFGFPFLFSLYGWINAWHVGEVAVGGLITSGVIASITGAIADYYTQIVSDYPAYRHHVKKRFATFMVARFFIGVIAFSANIYLIDQFVSPLIRATISGFVGVSFSSLVSVYFNGYWNRRGIDEMKRLGEIDSSEAGELREFYSSSNQWRKDLKGVWGRLPVLFIQHFIAQDVVPEYLRIPAIFTIGLFMQLFRNYMVNSKNPGFDLPTYLRVNFHITVLVMILGGPSATAIFLTNMVLMTVTVGYFLIKKIQWYQPSRNPLTRKQTEALRQILRRFDGEGPIAVVLGKYRGQDPGDGKYFYILVKENSPENPLFLLPRVMDDEGNVGDEPLKMWDAFTGEQVMGPEPWQGEPEVIYNELEVHQELSRLDFIETGVFVPIVLNPDSSDILNFLSLALLKPKGVIEASGEAQVISDAHNSESEMTDWFVVAKIKGDDQKVSSRITQILLQSSARSEMRTQVPNYLKDLLDDLSIPEEVQADWLNEKIFMELGGGMSPVADQVRAMPGRNPQKLTYHMDVLARGEGAMKQVFQNPWPVELDGKIDFIFSANALDTNIVLFYRDQWPISQTGPMRHHEDIALNMAKALAPNGIIMISTNNNQGEAIHRGLEEAGLYVWWGKGLANKVFAAKMPRDEWVKHHFGSRSEARELKARRDSMAALRFFYREILNGYLEMMRASFRPAEESAQKQAAYDAVSSNLTDLLRLMQGHPVIRRQLASRLQSAVRMLGTADTKRNPVAAETALMQAVDDILNKLYEPYLRKQIHYAKNRYAVNRVYQTEAGKWMLLQGVYSQVQVGKSGKVPHPMKSDKKFESLWELLRSLDHQLEKMAHEHKKISYVLSVIREVRVSLLQSQNQPLPDNLKKKLEDLLRPLSAKWIIEKQLAQQAIEFASQITNQEIRNRVIGFLNHAEALIQMRAAELESMIASIEQQRGLALSKHVKARNARLAKTLRALSTQFDIYFNPSPRLGLPIDSRTIQAKIAGVIRDVDAIQEPDLDGLMDLLRGIQSSFNGYVRERDDKTKASILRYVKSARGLIEFSSVRHEMLSRFEQAKRGLELSPAENAENVIFQSLFQEQIRKRAIVGERRIAGAWFDLYAFAREPLNVTVKGKRVSNPRFQALRVLAITLGSQTLESAAHRKQVRAIPGLVEELKKLAHDDLNQSVYQLSEESRKQLFDFIHTAFQLENKLPYLPVQYRVRSENRFVTPAKLPPGFVAAVAEPASGIFSVDFVSSMSRSEFREFFDGVFPQLKIERHKKIREGALQKAGLSLALDEGLIVSSGLAATEGFWDAATKLLADQKVAVFGEGESSSANVRFFKNVAEAKKWLGAQKVTAWVNSDEELDYAVLKEQVSDLVIMTRQRLARLYSALGLESLAAQLLGSRQILSAA